MMYKKIVCVAVLVICILAASTVYASGETCKLTASVSEITIGLDETAVIEFELSGSIPSGAQVQAIREKGMCDISWGNNRKSENGVVLSMNVTGILVGEIRIRVYVKDHEDIESVVLIKVVNGPGTISFMGIHWDITPEEFDQALLDVGIVYAKDKNTDGYSYWLGFDGVSSAPVCEIKSERFTYRSIDTGNNESILTKVAGYQVNSITAEFKPSYSYERKLIGKPYRLARASYSIWESDFPKKMTAWEVYDDLKVKLTKLYGEPTGSETGSSFTRMTTWWHAADGTGVSLRLSHFYNSYIIDIEYGVADESAYRKNILAIQQWEKQQVVDGLADDVSGL